MRLDGPRSELALVALASAAVGVAGYFVSFLAGQVTLQLVCKPLPAAALAVAVALAAPGASRTPVAAGLALGALGDLLIELPGGFLPALGSFLLGHLAYLGAFLGRSRALRPALALPFAAFCGVMLVVVLPGAGPLALPVAAYGLIIWALLWRAAAQVRDGQGWQWLALAGALCFAFSDAALAVNRFVAPYAGATVVVLLTYWAAQAAIALSALTEASTPSTTSGAMRESQP